MGTSYVFQLSGFEGSRGDNSGSIFIYLIPSSQVNNEKNENPVSHLAGYKKYKKVKLWFVS